MSKGPKIHHALDDPSVESETFVLHIAFCFSE